MSAEGDVTVNTTNVSTISVQDALCEVLRRSLYQDGLARGIREAVKALERKQSKLCVLAESCQEKEYLRLIEALCHEHNVNLIKVPDAKKLGEWTGLCKIDRKGEAQKVVSCACAVVKEFGEESEHLDVLLNYFKTR